MWIQKPCIVNSFVVQNYDLLCLNCELILKNLMRPVKHILLRLPLHFIQQNLLSKKLTVKAFKLCKNNYAKVNTHFRIYAWNLRFHHFDTYCIDKSRLFILPVKTNQGFQNSTQTHVKAFDRRPQDFIYDYKISNYYSTKTTDNERYNSII